MAIRLRRGMNGPGEGETGSASTIEREGEDGSIAPVLFASFSYRDRLPRRTARG